MSFKVKGKIIQAILTFFWAFLDSAIYSGNFRRKIRGGVEIRKDKVMMGEVASNE